jgi:hypothetical protein
MTPTVDQFLTRLAASPADTKAFDACSPGLNRREHCQLVLSKVENSCSTIAASKTLADARAANARLKAEVAIAKNRLKFLTPEKTVRHNLHAAPGKKLPVGPAKPSAYIKPVANARARLATAQIQASNSMKPQPPAAPSATHTAASFSAPKITMARAEFDKLNPSDSRRFFAEGGKLI